MSGPNIIIVHEPLTEVVVSRATPANLNLSSSGPQGIAGPEGPAGAPGGIGFEHIQDVAADTWPITHNLNKYPDVSVWIDDELTEGVTVEFVNLNQVVISLNIAKTGRARFQ
jgi:hypothetical protein